MNCSERKYSKRLPSLAIKIFFSFEPWHFDEWNIRQSCSHAEYYTDQNSTISDCDEKCIYTFVLSRSTDIDVFQLKTKNKNNFKIEFQLSILYVHCFVTYQNAFVMYVLARCTNYVCLCITKNAWNTDGGTIRIHTLSHQQLQAIKSVSQ